MFRQMFVVDAFVAEARADVENFVETATKQAFEREFLGNAKIIVLVERVHVRHERIGIGATGRAFEDRSINFDEAVAGEEVASSLPEL